MICLLQQLNIDLLRVFAIDVWLLLQLPGFREVECSITRCTGKVRACALCNVQYQQVRTRSEKVRKKCWSERDWAFVSARSRTHDRKEVGRLEQKVAELEQALAEQYAKVERWKNGRVGGSVRSRR